MPKCVPKVIVFDLDDTIGHFEEISIFLHGLQLIIGRSRIPKKISKWEAQHCLKDVPRLRIIPNGYIFINMG